MSNLSHCYNYLEKPSPPEFIKLLSATPETMVLSWRPGYDGNLELTEYTLQIKQDENEEGSKITRFFRNVNLQQQWRHAQSLTIRNSGPYRVRGLHPGTRYLCRVKAMNRLGFSGFSPVAAFSTLEKGKIFAKRS